MLTSRKALSVVVFSALLGVAFLATTRVMSADVSEVALTSPTGRNPKLLWTPERQGVWARMKAEYDSNSPTLAATWYRMMKTNAECSCRYNDNGIWPVLMYQITGDKKYVTLAWSRLQKTFFPLAGTALGGNFAREYFAELVVFYDWLYPGLSSAQRTTFLNKLNEMMTVLVSGNQWVSPLRPIRVDDSDQTTGSYFGLVFLYLATGDENPASVDVFNRVFVGGLDATAIDRATLRNAIAQYVTQLAEGGEWVEGSEYNPGTVRLLMMGAEGVRTATDVDHFPEVTRFLKRAALRPIYTITPDRKQSVQWGDEQRPRQFREFLYSFQTTNAMLAGLTQGDPAVGPYIQQYVHDLTTLYGPTGYLSAEPWGRAFYFFNPYAARADWRTLPRQFYAPGQGMMLLRNGWSVNSTLVEIHMPPQQLSVDHEVSYFGDFQIYRKGAWVLTHPLGYGGPTLTGEGTNAMVLGSFSSMAEYKKVNAVELPADSSYAYISGTTGGQKSKAGTYDPPATFLYEWTRTMLYLPSADTHSDTLVVFDRTHAENPMGLINFSRYRMKGPDEQTAIRTMPSVKQWVIHAPVEPRLDPQHISWSTANSEITVSTLLPVAQNKLLYDEKPMWLDAVAPASERKWQVRITPATEAPWDTFLNVVQVSDPGVVLTSTLVQSAGGEAQGALIQRPAHPDTLVLFNAVPGGRLPQPVMTAGRASYNPLVPHILSRVRWTPAPYSVTWTSSVSRTTVFLTDLSPERKWNVTVDGSVPKALVVSSQGVARVEVRGTGRHVLVLSN